MLSSNPTIATLNYLNPLNIADKLGFGATAEHVKNWGIVLYVKNYAQQRTIRC